MKPHKKKKPLAIREPYQAAIKDLTSRIDKLQHQIVTNGDLTGELTSARERLIHTIITIKETILKMEKGDKNYG